MSDPTAIRATFSDFKIVRTRSVVQLIFEIPIELADASLATLGGLPRSDSERWVGIARLDERKFDAEGNLPDEDKNYHEGESVIVDEMRKRRPFCELKFSQQAGIKSSDLKFQLWLSNLPVGKESEDAASAIRAFCGVETRANIIPGTRAGDRWIELLRMYEAECNGCR